MRIDIEDIALAVRSALEGRDVSEAWLFGSYARGEQSDDSDIDLRLVCGASIGYGELYEISLELRGRAGMPRRDRDESPREDETRLQTSRSCGSGDAV